jgi:hypothetical protein
VRRTQEQEPHAAQPHPQQQPAQQQPVEQQPAQQQQPPHQPQQQQPPSQAHYPSYAAAAAAAPPHPRAPGRLPQPPRARVAPAPAAAPAAAPPHAAPHPQQQWPHAPAPAAHAQPHAHGHPAPGHPAPGGPPRPHRVTPLTPAAEAAALRQQMLARAPAPTQAGRSAAEVRAMLPPVWALFYPPPRTMDPVAAAAAAGSVSLAPERAEAAGAAPPTAAPSGADSAASEADDGDDDGACAGGRDGDAEWEAFVAAGHRAEDHRAKEAKALGGAGGLDQRTPLWYQLRDGRLTASSLPGIMGWGFGGRDPLALLRQGWAEKAGLETPPPREWCPATGRARRACLLWGGAPGQAPPRSNPPPVHAPTPAPP